VAVNEIGILGINDRIIDGSNSQTEDQFYFIGSGKNYVKRSDSAVSIQAKASGNFYKNQNPLGKQFRDILDGGDSSNSPGQFIAPVIGGVAPTTKSGI
jgi:hypothetical protein